MTDERASTAAAVIERTEIDGVPVFWSAASTDQRDRVAACSVSVERTRRRTRAASRISSSTSRSPRSPSRSTTTTGSSRRSGPCSTLRARTHELVAFLESVTASLRALPLDRILLERRDPGPGGRGPQPRTARAAPLAALRVRRPWPARRGRDRPRLARTWTDRGTGHGHGSPGTTRPCGGAASRRPAFDWTCPMASASPSSRPSRSPDLRFPARTDMGGDGVSRRVPRRPERRQPRIVQDTLVRRLRQELRFERGLIYDVGMRLRADRRRARRT